MTRAHVTSGLAPHETEFVSVAQAHEAPIGVGRNAFPQGRGEGAATAKARER
jgi:hypothetical protein